MAPIIRSRRPRRTVVMNTLTEPLSDELFLAAVEAGSEPSCHVANVRLGLLMTRHFTPGEAVRRLLELITRRAAERGGQVHVTMTVAWLALIAHDGRQHLGDSAAFVRQHPWLARADHLMDFYEPATLASDAARHSLVPPDRSAIPGWSAFS